MNRPIVQRRSKPGSCAFPTDGARDITFGRHSSPLRFIFDEPLSLLESAAGTSFLAVPLPAAPALSAFGGGFHGFCPVTTRLSNHAKKRMLSEMEFCALQVFVAGKVGIGDHHHGPALFGVAHDDGPVILSVRPGHPFLADWKRRTPPASRRRTGRAGRRSSSRRPAP